MSACQAILVDYIEGAAHSIAHRCDSPDNHESAHVCVECGKRWQTWDSREDHYQPTETTLHTEEYLDQAGDEEYDRDEAAGVWDDAAGAYYED